MFIVCVCVCGVVLVFSLARLCCVQCALIAICGGNFRFNGSPRRHRRRPHHNNIIIMYARYASAVNARVLLRGFSLPPHRERAHGFTLI